MVVLYFPLHSIFFFLVFVSSFFSRFQRTRPIVALYLTVHFLFVVLKFIVKY